MVLLTPLTTACVALEIILIGMDSEKLRRSCIVVIRNEKVYQT